MSIKPRDSQRSKLYTSERAVKDFYLTDLAEMSELELFVEKKIRSSAPLLARYPKELESVIYVGDGRRRSNAGGDSRGIYMPKWSRGKWIVCHEVAHTIAHRRHGWVSIASHGREFAAIYLDLVRFAIGRDAFVALRQAFRDHSVKYKPKRVVSAERRAQLASIASVARQAVSNRVGGEQC